MNEFILTIVSVLLGFILGQSADIFKNLKENRERRKSIKKLVELEINKNKTLLTKYWKAVAKSEVIWFEKEKFNFVKLAYSINDIPFPKLSRMVWDNNINSISDVYKSNDIMELWDIYESYCLLIETKSHLYLKENESEKLGDKVENRVQNGSGFIGNVVKSLNFNENASDLAKQIKTIIENIIGVEEVKFINQ